MNKASYIRNRETHLARTKKYAQSHPDIVAKKTRKYQQANREKVVAHSMVYRYVKDGRLIKQPCMLCGATTVHAHHYKGYAKENWADVLWLCPRHHVFVEKLDNLASHVEALEERMEKHTHHFIISDGWLCKLPTQETEPPTK